MNPQIVPFVPIAEGIAQLLKPYAEVVIHDLESQEVCVLENNFSKRRIGSPSGLEESEFEQDVMGPYEKVNWDGRRLKSMSVVLRGASKKPLGLLCINIDVSHFEKIHQMLEPFLQTKVLEDQPESLFKDDWQEKINQFIQKYTQEAQQQLYSLNRPQKRELIEALAQSGAFQAKGVASYVGEVIGLSRASVYKYLSEWKEKT